MWRLSMLPFNVRTDDRNSRGETVMLHYTTLHDLRVMANGTRLTKSSEYKINSKFIAATSVVSLAGIGKIFRNRVLCYPFLSGGATRANWFVDICDCDAMKWPRNQTHASKLSSYDISQGQTLLRYEIGKIFPSTEIVRQTAENAQEKSKFTVNSSSSAHTVPQRIGRNGLIPLNRPSPDMSSQ